MSGENKEYTSEEVSQHNKSTDCWLIIGQDKQNVYDVTKYLDEHPGGSEVILEHAGQDATNMFEDIGHSTEARNTMKKFLIGTLKADPNAAKKKAAKSAAQVEAAASKGGLNPIVVIVLLIAILVGVYFTQIKK